MTKSHLKGGCPEGGLDANKSRTQAKRCHPSGELVSPQRSPSYLASYVKVFATWDTDVNEVAKGAGIRFHYPIEHCSRIWAISNQFPRTLCVFSKNVKG
ncbi:hypothetical protein FA13DRAFT_1739379 [Coprinellus micaceus]|uniref:Uncharacterized protein n=1 Tax=Coprinellus micaceus TaxID=71717 RepID=A0A4Y7SR57_COPMI|nr:hypothetical protein FA13DRAFT_1739379 [Coprinellus micaceus]